MRNYLAFGEALIAFQYPEDRDISEGEEIILEVQSKENGVVIDRTVKATITEIVKQDNKNRVLYYCELS